MSSNSSRSETPSDSTPEIPRAQKSPAKQGRRFPAYFPPGRGGSERFYRGLAAFLRPFLRLIARREWLGRQHLPARGPVIAVANHVTPYDPLVVAHFLFDSGRPPTILAKSSLFKVPVLGWVLRKTGQVPVYRGSKTARDALEAGSSALEGENCVLLYPEGTLTKDPELWPMSGKTGAARLALLTSAPVIPVAQWGAQSVLPRGKKMLRILPRKTTRVVAGPPIELDDLRERATKSGAPSSEDLRAATNRIMRTLTEMVGELRGEQPPQGLWDTRRGERVE